MKVGAIGSQSTKPDIKNFKLVSILGVVVLALLGWIVAISGSFEYGSLAARPIRLVTGLLIAATLVSLVAIYFGLKIKLQSRSLTWMIILFGISFRMMFLFVSPILEVDLYRYMWDGIVVNNSVSPYDFSPAQVLDRSNSSDPRLQKLKTLSVKTEALHTIVSRVHFNEYTTIYPPISQAVFAGSMALTPDSASVDVHIFAMKTSLVMFDLGTLLIVLLLIKRTGLHVAWLIVYAWSPLVIKEVANTGHLDAIAVFFVSASVLLMVFYLQAINIKGQNTAARNRNLFGSSLMLALGVGSKIFPVVLAPLMMVTIARCQWKDAVKFAISFGLFSAVVMFPMLVKNKQLNPWFSAEKNEASLESKEGLTSFLTQWRMNDLIFSGVYDNVKPDADNQERNRPWCVMVPNQTRLAITNFVRDRNISANPAFFVARIMTLGIFSICYLMILWRTKIPDPKHGFGNNEIAFSVEQCFLVLAVFFVLQPTQNPWYWLWATPLLCFARNRAWLLMSAVLLVYYLRFWFKGYTGNVTFFGYQYSGAGVFDNIVIWIEHSIIYTALIGYKFLKFQKSPE